MLIPALHLSVPLLFILFFTFAVDREPDINLSLMFIFSLIIFSAPHVIWTIAQKYAKPTKWVNHAAYLGASLALFIISCHPPDSTGLLNQWLAYWRLAALLMLICVAIAIVLQSRQA